MRSTFIIGCKGKQAQADILKKTVAPSVYRDCVISLSPEGSRHDRRLYAAMMKKQASKLNRKNGGVK